MLNSNIRLVYDDAILSQFRDLGTALETDESLNSIKLDPYWPKWDSPWWKAVLLLECGQAELIPRRFIDTLIAAVDAHYLHTFPYRMARYLRAVILTGRSSVTVLWAHFANCWWPPGKMFLSDFPGFMIGLLSFSSRMGATIVTKQLTRRAEKVLFFLPCRCWKPCWISMLPRRMLGCCLYYKQGQITSFRTAYFAARAERLSIPVGCNSAFPVIMIMMSCEDWLLWQSGLLLRVPSLIWRY